LKPRLRSGDRLRLLATSIGLALSLACAGDGVDDAAELAGASKAISTSNPAVAPERVVLISVAGLRPAHYGALGNAAGLSATGVQMPNLARMARAGAYADVMVPVLPAAPYPVHATLVTGLRPSRHGVLGDELLGPQGLYLRGIARESRIRGIPLWRAARAAGHSSTALNWPSTRGADVALLLPDLGIPEREMEKTWFGLLGEEATPWVVDRLKTIEPNLPELPWPSTLLRDELVERLACEMVREPVTPGLWLLTFEQSGTALARDGPGSDGASIGLSRVDAAIGRLIDCFEAAGRGDSTAFVVVGDRVLFPIHTVVYPNTVLESVGLVTPAPMHLGSGISRWDALVRSYGGAGVIYAEDETDALLARRALEEQAARTRAFRIVSAAELEPQGADPQAWFGIEAEPGYGIGKAARGAAIQATDRRGLGGYLPSREGSAVGFVAWGAGVRPRVRVPKLSQIDVAPTVAKMLGFELPGADGTPLVGILGRPGARP
jgi:hypothetical protein